MEMQVRSSIQNLVLAFRADATDASVRAYADAGKTEEAKEYVFWPVTKHHHVQWHKGERTEALVLGNGALSAVMAHPEDDTKVIKVWLNGPDGCWTYINKCWQLDAPEEWMPIVYELGVCMGKPYAIMEKLTDYKYTTMVSRFNPMHWESLFEDTFGFTPSDIHSGNVMYRRVVASDGTLQEVGVITDPVTEWE